MSEPTDSIPYGLCQCGCGQPAPIAPQSHTASGWIKGQPLRFIQGHAKKHGLSAHPLYRTWRGMLYRCEDPGHQAYANYGGRGIKVCERWHDVRAFIEDISRLIGPRPTGWTLDRVKNEGDYEPGNVRWASREMQAQNKRRPDDAAEFARRIWAAREWRTEVCERCGGDFQTRSTRHARYCAPCRHPKTELQHDQERHCHQCGATFSCHHSLRRTHCSRSCAVACRHAGGCPR